MARYEPEIIEKKADQLISRARSILISTTITWCAVGGIIGYSLGYALAIMQATAQPDTHIPQSLSILFAFFAFIFGFFSGRNKAFMLHVEAQHLLVQLQIEKNTRRNDNGNDDENDS